VFDILGRIISENMISEIYEELYLLPQKLWKPKIKAKIEEIEKTRKLVQEKIGSLLNGSKLNPQIYKDIQKIKRRAVDSGDIRRFLEIWTASNDGRYRENDGRIDIIVPAHMARRIGGSLKGTLDVEMARKFNIPYLALGNKKVQAILEDATKGSIAALGHPKKSGLLCVYNRSVVDGDGHKRNSETVMVFCNEDMTTSMVDVASVWDYAEVDALDGVTNSNRIAMMKEKADEEVCKDSEKFYNKQVSKLNEMCQKAKDTIDMYVATKVERHTESIDEWKSKIQTAPHYERLIKQARNKAKNVRSDGEKRKTEIDRRFKSELEIVLVGLATVAPQADYNARMMSDIAGMTIVLEHERKRANTDEERDLVKDVSGRDTGYDISTKYRCIEVKSFEGYPNPILTSHEWETARKHGDTYWLYVVENVHSNHKIHKIQDPYKVLAPLITQMEVTECRYTFNWVEWMRTKDGDTL